MSSLNDYKFKMYKFINSPSFVYKNVTLVDNKYYKDLSTGITYAIIVRSLVDLPKFKNPVIYLSNNPFSLKRLTETYDSKRWTAERINKMSGEEFDFIILRQKSILKLTNRD